MQRRSFLRTLATAPAAFAAGPRLSAENQAAPSACPPDDNQKLAGLSLPQLRDQYRRDLFDDWLPFMDKHVIDRQYGGFLCNTGMDGVHADENKRTTYEGRGIWVYSFLYNHFGRQVKHLEAAARSVEFILKAMPSSDDAVWPRDLTRDGKPLTAGEIYGDLFVAEGLAEYSLASGERRYSELAKQVVFKCLRLYDQPNFRPDVGRSFLGPAAPPFPGARAQGTWMVLLRCATQMLQQRPDAQLEQLASRCVDAIMRFHYNPEFRLNNELLNHDLSRPTGVYGQLVYTGHAIETLWMVMTEALRIKNEALFREAAARFRCHVDVSRDGVYGGLFQNLRNVEQNLWSLDKELWPHEEALIGSLTVLDHSGDAWAAEMFSALYTYVREKFPLHSHGSPLWMHASDRKVSFEAYARLPKRVENYHHPRHLMLNLLRLERMMERS